MNQFAIYSETEMTNLNPVTDPGQYKVQYYYFILAPIVCLYRISSSDYAPIWPPVNSQRNPMQNPPQLLYRTPPQNPHLIKTSITLLISPLYPIHSLPQTFPPHLSFIYSPSPIPIFQRRNLSLGFLSGNLTYWY